MFDYFFILVILLSFIFVFFHNKVKNLINIYNYPKIEDKTEINKIPITGGILFFVNILLYSIFIFFLYSKNINIVDNSIIFRNFKDFVIFNFAVISFFCVGFFDDKYNLSPNYRLFLFSLISYILISIDNSLIIKSINFDNYSLEIFFGNFSLAFTILCVLIFVNAYNMLDGINGFSSIYLIIFCAFLIFKNNEILMPKVIMLVCFFNLYLNLIGKSFMGNNGSYLLALLCSYLSIKYHLLGYLDEESIIVLMALPITDLIRVSFFRVINGKHPFKGDKNHIHHLLFNKFNLFITLLILTILILLPIFINLFYSSFIFSIIIFFIFYFFIIFKFR